MKNKSLFLVILIVGILGIGLTLTYYSYDNQYITLNNLYEAQVSDDKIVYDEVWKVVKQQAQVSEQYAESFKSIYLGMMDARYSKDSNATFKWIKEQNPEFSQDMYMKLMNTIESQRSKFTSVQRKLITYHQEISNLVKLWPSRIFVGGRPIPELKIVTSTKTENTFNTGKEDDMDVFEKK